MSNDNKNENKKEALNEEAKKKELSQEELEQVNGGRAVANIGEVAVAKLVTAEVLQGKDAVVEINTAGQPGSEMRIRAR